MAQYFTDFGSYTSTEHPTGWTARWVTSNVTYTVEEVGGATGGKVLRAVRSSNGRSLLSWDEIDADSARANFEILTRIRSNTAVAGASMGGTTGRGAGSSGSETGWNSNPIRSNSPNRGWSILRYNGGASNTPDVGDLSWDNSTWYWSRFRVNGEDIKLKRWAGAIGDEPGTWLSEITNSVVAAAGWVGPYIFNTGITLEYDVFGVGTDGDAAPSSAPSGGASIERAKADPVAITDSASRISDIKRTIRRQV